jgi:hypothetical protein
VGQEVLAQQVLIETPDSRRLLIDVAEIGTVIE